MKKLSYFLIIPLLAGLASCSSDDSFVFEGNLSEKDLSTRVAASTLVDIPVGQTKTLTFDANLLTDGYSTSGFPGKYWKNTYNENNTVRLEIDNFFVFSRRSFGDWLPTYSYWDGFTLSNVEDNTNHAEPGVSSEGFVAHQWGTMALGGPVDNAPVPGEASHDPYGRSVSGIAGNPFIVGYWGYYGYGEPTPGTTGTGGNNQFNENVYSNWIKLGNAATYRATGIYVNIHPWAHYGVTEGDGFASPFKSENDYLKLYIYGVDVDNKVKPTPVVVDMAKYRSGVTATMTGWHWIDLISLGNDLKYLVFQMAASDGSQWGPNTAVYFSLAKLQVKREK